MDDVLEQFIECDKSKTMSNIFKGLSMVLLVFCAFFLTASLLLAIVIGLLALGSFILSYLTYVEYEYEFFEDTITVSKIYNESKRKTAKSISNDDIRKVYANKNLDNKKDKNIYFNTNTKGLAIYTFELTDNSKVQLALNDKFQRRVGITYAMKLVRQF